LPGGNYAPETGTEKLGKKIPTKVGFPSLSQPGNAKLRADSVLI
jgi:hypothetical protein